MSQKEIKKFIDDLKKKLENMVHRKVVITKVDFGPSIEVEIFPSAHTKFTHIILLSEIVYLSECFGPEDRLDLISKRIVDKYKDKESVLRGFIKED